MLLQADTGQFGDIHPTKHIKALSEQVHAMGEPHPVAGTSRLIHNQDTTAGV